MNNRSTIAAALLATFLVFLVPGCDQQGPMEKAGEKIDDTVEDAGDAVEDATDQQ